MVCTAFLRVLLVRLLVVLLLGFGASPGVRAQVAPVTAPAGPGLPATASQPTPLDTAAAIHRLFAKRRLRRDLIAGSLGADVFAGAIVSSLVDRSSNGGGSSGYGSLAGGGLSFDGADYLFIYALPALPLILANFAIHAGYSRKWEARLINALQAHQLPARLRRKLKPRYFRQAAGPVNLVAARC